MGDLTTLTYAINTRRPTIERFESYFDGTAEVAFVGDALQDEFGQQLKHMFVNRCAPIIESTLDRLQVRGFEGDRADEANTAWQTLRLGRVARAVHFDALTSGDGWVLVWPDEDGIKVVPQEPTDIAVLWNADDPNVIDVAAKTWQLRDGKWRLNLYYADRLEKFVTNGPYAAPPDVDDGWTRYSDQGDIAWPIPHNMGRVPIFHFSVTHRAGTYGRSDLAAIIPLQDRLNLTIANQAVAEEFQSFRQRWATGIQLMRDEDGNPVSPFTNGADRLWIVEGENATFGEFGAADLMQFEGVIEGHEVRIARTARIPMHHLVQNGEPPSGEALKTAEAPFVAKVKARQSAFGDTWADLMMFVMSINGVDTQLRTIWEPAATRDEHGELERALLKQSIGVSKPSSLRELGYSDSDIELFAHEISVDEADMAEATIRAFNAVQR